MGIFALAGKPPANREQSYSEGSKYNLHEVWIVLQVMKQLRRDGYQDIGVISPYSAQVSELKNALEKDGDLSALLASPRGGGGSNSWTDLVRGQLEIKTVDGYQGREKSAIILSCVRTEGLGFLT